MSSRRQLRLRAALLLASTLPPQAARCAPVHFHPSVALQPRPVLSLQPTPALQPPAAQPSNVYRHHRLVVLGIIVTAAVVGLIILATNRD